jgi:regulator of protease activity HflC (stomatin/prohibitin superfamily)
MDEIYVALIIIFGLFFFVISMNVKLVPKDTAAVVERLGKFHKIINEPGIYFMIPLIDRIYQSVSTVVERHAFKFNHQEDIIHFSYMMDVVDVKLFVYGEFDTVTAIDKAIEELYIESIDKDSLDLEPITTFAAERGVNIFNIMKDN